jgi:hypothetical protein
MEAEMPEYVEFTYEKIVWNIDGSTDDLAVDPTNPNAEGDLGEVSVVKLLDATTPSGDTFDFTTAPTEASAIFKLDDLLITSVHPPLTTDDLLPMESLRVDPTAGDDRLGDGSGFVGGVSVACGDISGDSGGVPLGDPITFTYTVNNTSSAYEGSHALYQDVLIPI